MSDAMKVADRSIDVLFLLRRIIRATDLHSRRLVKAAGLTAPQLVVLAAIRDLGEVTAGRISSQVSLSQATVSPILDRLESRGLIDRYRSATDRRVVHARLTEAGEAALAKSPPPLQEAFATAFEGLPEGEQSAMIGTLRKIADMMEEGDQEQVALFEDQDIPGAYGL